MTAATSPTDDVQFFPLAEWSVVEVRGADRQAFLNKFCTNDLAPLQAGQGAETFFTDVKGKVLAHAIAAIGDEAVRLVTVPGQALGLIAHLDRYCIREQVEFVDATATTQAWHLWGPGVEAAVARAAGGTPSLPQTQWQCGNVSIGGTETALLRFPLGERPSWLATSLFNRAECVERSLLGAGATLASAAAWDAQRIEAGWPLFGVDFGPDALPQEVGRDSVAISFRKGCYLGQETVARIDALGHVNRRLAAVLFAAGTTGVAVGDELHASGKSVGRLTSLCDSPRYGKPLGLAMLRREAHVPGARLECGAALAEVIATPGDAPE
ncbi:MAG: folate-binding protein YgfZ [Pirellulales bacterium]|nr:folate-binding protein YgfZ [Pirellulales bacterium]